MPNGRRPMVRKHGKGLSNTRESLSDHQQQTCPRPAATTFQSHSLRAGDRQNSLSCAPCCAALSLRTIPNRRICGPLRQPQQKVTPMTGILQNYLPLVVFIGVAALIGLALLIAPFLVAFQQPDPEKLSAYECGFNAFDDARMKFDVRFYLVAILFIIFDLEVAFLFPWAVAFGKLGATGFWSMLVFLAVLTVRNTSIDQKPVAPSLPNATAQGNRNATSRSKMMKRIATR